MCILTIKRECFVYTNLCVRYNRTHSVTCLLEIILYLAYRQTGPGVFLSEFISVYGFHMEAILFKLDSFANDYYRDNLLAFSESQMAER